MLAWIVTVCVLQFFLAGTSWALITATPTQEWVTSYVGPGGTEQVKAITVDAQGNVYVAGSSHNGAGNLR